jgi:hypothetical protein
MDPSAASVERADGTAVTSTRRVRPFELLALAFCFASSRDLY